ncbi:MAG: GNAT family N-acetyltransferase [archaeon]|jgi:ribosomal protein S18 acetylase RimI-like enzyme
MIIRKATNNDTEAIINFMMVLRKLEHKITDFVNDSQETRDFLLNDFILKRLGHKDYFFFVAEENNKIVGIIIGWKEFISPVYNNANVLYLCDAIVDPTFRGKGIGKKLVHSLESEAKKCGLNEAILEVLVKNVKSIDFWKKMNYEPVYLKMRKKI